MESAKSLFGRFVLMAFGIPALAYGLVAASVWLNNTLDHSPSWFIGQVDLFGVPIIVDSPSLGWISGFLIACGTFAVWRAQAAGAHD